MRGIIELKAFNQDSRKPFLEKLKQWYKLYHQSIKYEEYSQLTDEIY